MRGLRFIISLALAYSASAEAQSISLDSDRVLRLRYSVQCDSDAQARSSFPGIMGQLTLDSRTLRFNLLRYSNEMEVTLTASEVPDDLSKLAFEFEPESHCHLLQFEPILLEPEALTSMQVLARKYSPYVVIRNDQYRNPHRDIPLGLTYSVIPEPTGGFRLRYTYFFSNESVKGPFTTTKATSLGSYGRRNDIEWIYEIKFDESQNIVSRTYQGGILFGAGHTTYSFRGRTLEGTDHPILYDIAIHNVFSAYPSSGRQAWNPIGFHFVPREELVTPFAREAWLWNHPWTFDVADRELMRSGKLSFPSSEYLFVRIRGSLNGASLKLDALFDQDSEWTPAGEGRNTIKKLGEDLFGQESYSAIHFGDDPSQLHGKLKLTSSRNEVDLHSLQFYLLSPNASQGFEVKDITSQFQCESSALCQF